MENQKEKQQMTNSQNSWHPEELELLAKALTFCYKTQTTYKEALDISDRLAGWKFVLEGDYSVEQVCYALKIFMKKSTPMPVPADIEAILNPPKPRITEAQFIEAQKWQEKNNWPMISHAQDTIDAYRQQAKDEQADYATRNTELLAVAGSSVRRIGHVQ